MDDERAKLVDNIRNRRDMQTSLSAAARIVKTKLDGLAIFRPTAYQESVILCKASEILVQGGTRSGKSLVVIAMVAAYLRNMPITFADGSQHFVREEAWRERPVVVWLVGDLLKHIGQTVHRLLCRAGAFDMVCDEQTGLWRAWQPGRIEGDDAIPPNKRKPAPPFIPPSEIVDESWENKRAFEFKALTMSNGSIAYGYASSGNVKRGDPVNLIFIDETIEDSNHYPEYQSRISDRKGRIIWATYPFMNTSALVDLNRRAVQQKDDVEKGRRKSQDVQHFVFVGSNSPFVDDEEKRKRREGWSLAQYRARDLGEFISDTILAYPEFDVNVHVADYGVDSPLNDAVTKALRANNYNAPEDWRVDLILDPGTTRPALLWVAIPPPSFWDEKEPYHVVYRELAIPRIDAKVMAHLAKAADPTRVYVSFLGDSKAGDQTPMGFSSTVFANYSDEFEKVGLRCQDTESLFVPGSTTWVTRSMALRKLMRRRVCGRPRLRIVAHQCPELVNQLGRLLKGVTKEDVLDKLAPGQVHDQTDCLEYYAAFNPLYVYPPPPEMAMDPILRLYNRDKEMLNGIFARNKPNSGRQPIVLGIPD